MSYPFELKANAVHLRREGYSIKEIAKKLNISVATSSLWLGSILLDQTAMNRLKKRRILGQYKAQQTRREKRNLIRQSFYKNATLDFSKIIMTKPIRKILCSLLYWAEGGKYTDSYVNFINSDPLMMKTFLKLLRTSFKIDEHKLRALIHLHEYHVPEVERIYWSQITEIPLTQFSKNYLKPNTKNRIREDYRGTIRISYYDHKIALELRALYNMLAKNLGV